MSWLSRWVEDDQVASISSAWRSYRTKRCYAHSRLDIAPPTSSTRPLGHLFQAICQSRSVLARRVAEKISFL